jgi:hypothetical protein
LWERSTNPAPAEPPRRSFALTGRSVHLDPLHNAVRADLADIRLAEYVFAPHYAAPMPCTVTRPAALHLTADTSSEVLAELAEGEMFEVLEVLRQVAWGVSPDRRLAGYVNRAALERIK